MSRRTLRPIVALAAATAALSLLAPAAAPASAAGVTPYVIGGQDAATAYPFMVSLQNVRNPEYQPGTTKLAHLCGGTLIDPQWVVTAAHCVDPSVAELGLTVVRARIGSTRTNSGGEVVAVDATYSHPDYDVTSETEMGNDIALVHLSRPAQTPPIRIGRVPGAASGPTGSAPVRLIGWGRSRLASDRMTTRLQELDTFLVRPSTCNRYWSAGDLCVDDPTRPQTSACNGDSGGPLLVQQGGTWRLIGATSRVGSDGRHCTGASIYTSVPKYRAWLEATIGHPLP